MIQHLTFNRRQITRAYGTWLKTFPFQLFCTFTFTHPVSDPQADKLFREFISVLERAYRSPLAWVRGDEKRFSGCGMPASPRHYHVLMASSAHLHPEVVKTTWAQFAGNRRIGSGTSAVVVPYDPAKDGAGYCLKFINEPDGDWSFHNLDLFSPAASVIAARNRRSRRRFRRQTERILSVAHGVIR